MKHEDKVTVRQQRALLGGASSVVICGLLIGACSGSNGLGLIGGLEGGPGIEGGSLPEGSVDPIDPDASKPCTGLECDKPDCKDGETTTLRGKVYDPAGANVLYGVRVFVPNGPLPALTAGASCDACGEIAPAPVALAHTDAKGEFVLEGVPVGANVPVVVQAGKWRRKVEISITKKCAENVAPDRDLRLPKNGSEGDMPHIAVTAGGCDALECLLRGIGVDASEFVPGADMSGHIHVFNGEGGAFPGGPKAGGSVADPAGGELWNSAAKLAPYDTVLLSCECSEQNENKGGAVGAPGARQALYDYATAGGRVIATHFHYTWLKHSPQQDWQQLSAWTTGGSGSGLHSIDTSTAQGKALSDWLVTVNASSSPGQIQLTDVTNSLTTISPPAQALISKDGAVRYFSFPAPTTGTACGRVAFSDLHAMGISAGGSSFPVGCPSPGGLSAQQKALEFLVFDLAACK